jgi:hypothetical protein
MPGARSVALSWLGLFGGADLRVAVIDPARATERLGERIDYVSSAYFDAAGMRIVSGRGFTRNDREDTPRVAVVNETFVRSAFGRGDVIARPITLDMPDVKDMPFNIVGVVRDSKHNDLREASVPSMVWAPLRQAPQAISSIIVRAEPGYDKAIAQALRPDHHIGRSRAHGAARRHADGSGGEDARTGEADAPPGDRLRAWLQCCSRPWGSTAPSPMPWRAARARLACASRAAPNHAR